MKVAIYARVSTQTTAKTRTCRRASFGNTLSAAARPLPVTVSTSTLGSQAQRRSGRSDGRRSTGAVSIASSCGSLTASRVR